MHLEYGFVRRDRPALPASRLPLVPILPDMGWCDAPRHPLYNRLVRLPFAASHETLTRSDGLYDVCLVLDWNRTCRRRHGGSAIFLHIARPDYSPTEGCIAVSATAMRYIIAHARAGTTVMVP
jgi:L,D-peptidoglycan transpeptidase YkuD (ErfK/YbiS/YcfS/YnhG family)